MAMPETRTPWTVADLRRLPEDGNRYEVVRGALFVTAAPSYRHQRLASVLGELLQPYVVAHALGEVSYPRSVIRIGRDTEVEPDLMVRPVPHPVPARWEDVPLPILVMEILSDATRHRDHVDKRAVYLDAGIPDYWIVDGDRRSLQVVRPNREDIDVSTVLVWDAAIASEPFRLDVREYFRVAFGE